jgi:hypothetical protein
MGGALMWITQSEAVEMYARFLAARHGGAAGQVARKTADKLRVNGDVEGYAVWSRVAEVVERHSPKTVELEGVTPLS